MWPDQTILNYSRPHVITENLCWKSCTRVFEEAIDKMQSDVMVELLVLNVGR
jgi:hypothetical protein